ncbi:hypothetical protein J22TS1_43470 [Siminovitchia terrae]|uniref:hypothetical protein n=1 Tax=Siminovitchia terrae TaxID=1914933 RepID=UPI001B0A8D4A|nr:hypothetical protein [Siminovitchia terrae]GIN93296.1 hypothetical protein J22TS1_43470 [Siminovitchia terrae]
MQKLFLIYAATILVFLVGCSKGSVASQKSEEISGDEVEHEEIKGSQQQLEEDRLAEEPKEEVQNKQNDKDTISVEKVEELITYAAINYDDWLINVDIKNKEIIVEIDLAPHNSLEPKSLAITSYSQASDELLKYDGWNHLTITYINIGTIRMNKSEAETNELGKDYFPADKIKKNLK